VQDLNIVCKDTKYFLQDMAAQQTLQSLYQHSGGTQHSAAQHASAQHSADQHSPAPDSALTAAEAMHELLLRQVVEAADAAWSLVLKPEIYCVQSGTLLVCYQ
jgi:hypothetical protein